MHVQLASAFEGTSFGKEASDILGKCVHCGFCTATCPTYQLLGDELDGPRGRIYLVKQLLETKEASKITRVHLDRCLTCRSCETTCPSDVHYGRLVELARPVVDELCPRPVLERLGRWSLVHLMLGPWFGLLLRIGQTLRGLLPESVARHIPKRYHAGIVPRSQGNRRVLMLDGCVQPAMAPQINAAARRVLAKLDVDVRSAKQAGCCGALQLHLGDTDPALDAMRRNIDAWWPEIENGVEAIVMTASGCGVTVREYGQLLKNDPVYFEKAERVSELTVDLSEFISPEDVASLGAMSPRRVAFHSPCTLQHGQGIRGKVERILKTAGADLVSTHNSHLCCGAAGTYSVLQSELSIRLLDQKISDLNQDAPELIVTANLGCLAQLASSSPVPVRHWIELIDPSSPG